MMPAIEPVLEHSETVVIGSKDPEFESVPDRIRAEQALVDFVRVTDRKSKGGRYDGICW